MTDSGRERLLAEEPKRTRPPEAARVKAGERYRAGGTWRVRAWYGPAQQALIFTGPPGTGKT